MSVRAPKSLEYVGGSAIALPPRKILIVAALKAADGNGLTLDEIHEAGWRNGPAWRRRPPVTAGTVKTYLQQINKLLDGSDLHIVAHGRGEHRRWFLQQR